MKHRHVIDWAAIRRRLEALGTAAVVDPAVTRALLEQRARALARPATAPAAPDEIAVITFTLGSERYALDARVVRAVFPTRQVALLPGATAPTYGVTSWRGELLTICDLRSVLGLTATALNDLARVIVVGDGRVTFGFLADHVETVVSLSASAVGPLSDGAASRRFLRGMTSDALLLLDATELLKLVEPPLETSR